MEALRPAVRSAARGRPRRAADQEMPIFDAHCTTAMTPGRSCRRRQSSTSCARPASARHGVELEQRGHQDAAGRGARRHRAGAPALSLARRVSHLGRDPTVIPFLEDLLAKRKYVAIGEFHIYGADADLPNMRRIVELARQHGLFLHSHSDSAAVERHFQQDPEARVLWAHSGFERPENVREMLRKLCRPVVRPRLPDRARLERQGGAGLARGLPGIPRPLPGRHRHLHARAAALRRRACALVAPVAGRPAARCRREDRLTRTASGCSADQRHEAVAGAASASWSRRPAWADCPLDLGHGTGIVIFSDHYMLALRPEPMRIEVGQPFSLLINVCTKGGDPAELVAVDAHDAGAQARHELRADDRGRRRRPLSGRRAGVPHAGQLGSRLRRARPAARVQRLTHDFILK